MNSRRPTAIAAVLAAVVLSIAVAPASASSYSSAYPYYNLTATTDIPAASTSSSGPQLIFSTTPGSIVAPTAGDAFSSQASGTLFGPLFIPNQAIVSADGQTHTTGSSVDLTKLVVAKKSIPASGSSPAQDLFGLALFGNGIKAGDHIVFSLNVADAKNPPVLALDSTSPLTGVTISSAFTLKPDTPPITSPVNGNVPEPLSLAIWSSMIGVGLLRARVLKRRSAA